MFRYPQVGSSNPVNQYDIGISFRYYQTSATIIHAEGTREFYITPSGNYTDRPIVSKQYQLITTRLNDYITDVSNLFGKLAVRSDKFTDEKNTQGDGYFNSNGILVQTSGSGFIYQKLEIDSSKIYRIRQIFGNYPTVSALVLFDEHDEIISTVPYNYPSPSSDKYFVFAGVHSIGISFVRMDNNSRLESFDIQDLTTVLNTQQGNRALYVAAGAVYNEQTGFYELNGLTDITEKQMREIYLQTHVMDKLSSYYNIFASSTFRTNLGFNMGITQTNGRMVSFRESFFFNQKLEVLRLSFDNNINETRMIRTDDMFYAFYGCKKLKRIISPIYVYDIKDKLYFDYTFSQCILLETALLYKLRASISFPDSPLLSLESLQYMITNAANTSPITVTVHADVYAKIQDESNADWHSLLSAAQEKQITFATA
jgi:hypothetical protein